MKFKLYSLSALAIAALMTACSTDDEIVQNPVTASEVETPAISIKLDELATRGFLSEKGAWTNFKKNNNGVQEDYDARVNLMIYNTNNPNEPIVTAAPQYITKDSYAILSSDQISFEPLRVPAGASYTAVAWVDFVSSADHSVAFYDVANLNNVKMNFGEGAFTPNGAAGAEMRDAYTGKVTFTLSPDGTTALATANAEDMIETPNATTRPEPQEATAEAKANVTTLNILARRHFSKVRIVMTDYATKGEWMQYFKGEDPSRVFNAEAMKIKDLATQFNALTQETVATVGGGDKIFMSEYNYQEPTINWVTIEASVPATVANYKDLLQETGMKGVSVEDLAALDDNAVVFPVLSYNYLIPANQTDAAVYDMDFAALSKQGDETYVWSDGVTEEPSTAAWKTLMVRHINSVPVVKNTLTTIWGNFLTVETPTFIVTINDVFDNEVDRVLINDDSTTQTIITIDGVRVDIYRDAAGNIVSVDVDKNENKITADNWEELVAGLNDLKTWTDASVLNIYFNETLVDDDPILNTEIDQIKLIAEGTLADAYTSTGFINDVEVISDVEQPDLTITSTKEIFITGVGPYNNLTLHGDKVSIADTYPVPSMPTESTDKVKVKGDVNITTDNHGIYIVNVDIDGNVTTDDTTTWIYFSKVGGNVDVTGGANIFKTDIAGNLAVSDKAVLKRVNVTGTTTLNGDDNEIDGTQYGGLVTLNGTTTIKSGTFNSEVIAKDALLVNDGTFNDNVRVFADATFNGGTVSTVNDKFVVAETPGTTLTMNAWVGNVCCGDAVVQTSQKVIITGTATENVPDYVAGKYTRYGLTNLGFIVQ